MMAEAPVDTTTPLVDEQASVYRRRYREARQAGLSIVEASLFADSTADVGELRRLQELGCDPATIAEIVI